MTDQKTTDSFTIVVLPDTQFYCDTRLKLSHREWNRDLRENFYEQTRWVKDSRELLNTAFVLHVGDIVQTDYPEEWEIARDAMSVLDGHVPLAQGRLSLTDDGQVLWKLRSPWRAHFALNAYNQRHARPRAPPGFPPLL